MSEENRLTLLGIDFNINDPAELERLRTSIPLSEDEFVATLPEALSHSPATGAHVVVVGGGIMGLLTAVFLRLEGHQVTVLERKLFGAAASTRNGGGILALGRDVREIPFILTSMKLWSLLPELGIETQVSQTGHAMIAMNDTEANQLLQAQALYAAAGLETEWLTPQEALSLLPDLSANAKGALYSPVDMQDYPFTVIASALAWLQEHGVQLVYHCEVTGFEVAETRITEVHTTKGSFPADAVVLCTGPWTTQVGELLGLTLPVLARRSQIAVTESFEQRTMHPFVSGNALYARQTQFGNVVFGGGGAWEKVGYDVRNTVEAMQMLSTRLVEMFPEYRYKQLLRAWAGTVEITPDHFPLLGTTPDYDNLYISAGYSGHGYGLAALAGRIVSRLVTEADRPNAFSPDVLDLLARVQPMRFQDGLAPVHS